MVAKVTIHKGHETDRDDAITAVADTYVVTDTRGRKITLRKPQVLAQFRLVRLLPPEVAQNSPYIQMLFPALFVTRIDDMPFAFPQSEREIEALITLLDDDGLSAVLTGVQEHWGADIAPADRDAVKN